MSSPVYWRPEVYFYPLGNTPAISLTQHISSEQSADILLLGCGDPRNILFTLYADVSVGPNPRKIDFTCCDLEPAVLARNIILFTLLEENTSIDMVGAIFYHFKISDHALDILTRQSKLLFKYSESIKTWLSSPYGTFIRFLDSRTLSELRRHWKYYADFSSFPSNRVNKLRLQQVQFAKSVLKKFPENPGPARSAGMMWRNAGTSINNAFQQYWKTGTTFNSESDIKKAVNLNPTFLYSVSGETFSPHDQTFPQGFHLAPAFMPVASDPVRPGASGLRPSPMDLSKLQFRAWCGAFKTFRETNAITIRFYSGDALALCRTLDLFKNLGSTSPDLLNSAWSASRINLDQLSASHSSPTTFDVIDTSNMANHVGLLHVLLAAQPLLKKKPASKSILYTEELIHAGEVAADPFLRRLCTSVPTLAALVGLAPLDYLSGFTSHSNVHEPLAGVSQCLERVTWVDPTGGDRYCDSSRINLSFDAEDLARIMFDIYQKILCFSQDVGLFMGQPMLLMSRLKQSAFYHPETLAMLFQLVKRRVHLKAGTWDTVVEKFLELAENRPSRPVELEKFQNLRLQLHLYGVYSDNSLTPDWRSRFQQQSISSVFKESTNIPPVQCVILTVPRQSILRVLGKDKKSAGILALQCNLRANSAIGHSYTSIRCVWGTCNAESHSGIEVLTEDPHGADGESDLIVSFWAASHTLAYETKTIGFALMPTHDVIALFVPKLGEPLEMFTANLDDRQHVKLLPYRPTLTRDNQPTSLPDVIRFQDPTASSGRTTFWAGAGKIGDLQTVISYTHRVEIDSPAEQRALLNGANPSAIQVSPCTMRLSIDNHEHLISYPYPILGSGHKLRIARKSHYVEVISPISNPLDFGGYSQNLTPVRQHNPYSPWNIHHINLNRMPLLDTKGPNKLSWLNYHTGLQMSDRERAIMSGEQHAHDSRLKLMPAIKDTIHGVANDFAAFWGKREVAFGLCEPNDTDHFYAVLLVGGLRIDLASFTVVIDTAIIPTTESTAPMVFPFLDKYMKTNPLYTLSSMGDEAIAWKRLLPAFIERTRNWEHTPNCEYKTSGQAPISFDKGDEVICFCGTGIGFEADIWKVPGWKPLLPFATRAAISPLFCVPYLESSDRLIQNLQQMMEVTEEQEDAGVSQSEDECWTCGSPGKSGLLTCSKCKKARYCSTQCQRQDWKEHKKSCQAS